MTRIIHKGATGAPALREFHCPPCDAWFDAFTKWDDTAGSWEQRTHSCGTLCSTRIRPGSKIAIRGGEWNSVPRDHLKAWQSYWKLTDNQAAQVTREEMDRVCLQKGISFVDASWDNNKNGSKRERGEAVELPPDTDNAAEVDAWDEKKFGPQHVQERKEQIRAVFEQAMYGTVEKLPEATDTNAHATPHVIDVEKVQRELAAAEVGPQIEVVSR